MKETSVLILLLTFFMCIYVLLNTFVANDHILNLFIFSWCSVATSGLKILSVHFSTFVTFFFFFYFASFCCCAHLRWSLSSVAFSCQLQDKNIKCYCFTSAQLHYTCSFGELEFRMSGVEFWGSLLVHWLFLIWIPHVNNPFTMHGYGSICCSQK